MKSKRWTQEGNTTSLSVDLPVEIIEKILSTVPVKSLIRLQSVCKFWRNIISDPRFHRLHYHTTRIDNLHLIMRSNHREFEQLIRPETLSGRQLERPSHKAASAVGSCNGVVLMRQDFDGVTYLGLWNPSIGKHHGWIQGINGSDAVYGLYYDPQLDDYMIVMFSRTLYHIYSCKRAIWGESKALPSVTYLQYWRSQVIFNGTPCLYWLESAEVVRFDVRDGKSRRIALPDVTDFLPVQLCLIRAGRVGLLSWHRKWILEKDDCSWRELADNENNIGEVFRRCLIYNHGEKRLQEIRLDRFEDGERIVEGYLIPYSESLCFPVPDYVSSTRTCIFNVRI